MTRPDPAEARLGEALTELSIACDEPDAMGFDRYHSLADRGIESALAATTPGAALLDDARLGRAVREGLPLHKDITIVGVERDGVPEWHIRIGYEHEGTGPDLLTALRRAPGESS